MLGWTSTALLIAVILLLFRRLRWVLLPILIVQATLLWTKAILVLSGIQLTMVSSILGSLVTIIGVATVMHMSLVYCERANAALIASPRCAIRWCCWPLTSSGCAPRPRRDSRQELLEPCLSRPAVSASL